MRVAITGSSGLLGTALSEALRGSGHEVLGVRRGPATRGGQWDPASGWVAPGLLEGYDAVVNLAGASIGEGRWTAARKRLLRTSRIDATRLLVEHMGTLPVPPAVFVCASGAGYYGDRGDTVLTEDAARGDGFLADLVQDWEAEAFAAERIGVRVVAARSALVLAKHGGAFPRMLLPFRLGVGGRLGSGRQWFPWITLADEVRALEFALTHDRLHGPVNFAAAHAVRNSDFTRVLARVLHRPALFPVPRLALRIALGEAADELLLTSARVAPARLLDAGFVFEHPELEPALRVVLGRPQDASARAAAAG